MGIFLGLCWNALGFASKHCSGGKWLGEKIQAVFFVFFSCMPSAQKQLLEEKPSYFPGDVFLICPAADTVN